jgi:hypothetical protein
MKFSRKLIVREGTYGTISVPKPVLDAWASVEDVEMEFDEASNRLVIAPKPKSETLIMQPVWREDHEL